MHDRWLSTSEHVSGSGCRKNVPDEDDEENEISHNTELQKWHETGGIDLDTNLTPGIDEKSEGLLLHTYEAVSLHYLIT